jgi:hypothetical protein
MERENLNLSFDVPATIAFGKDLIHAEPEEIGAVITTYNSARLHLEKNPRRSASKCSLLDECAQAQKSLRCSKDP